LPSVHSTQKLETSLRRKRIQKILAVVQRIPRGKVASYGQVAELAGYPNQARLVGWILRGLPVKTSIPWQRVVNHRGHIPSRGRISESVEQIQRLRNEGILVTHLGDLDLSIYRWIP